MQNLTETTREQIQVRWPEMRTNNLSELVFGRKEHDPQFARRDVWSMLDLAVRVETMRLQAEIRALNSAMSRPIKIELTTPAPPSSQPWAITTWFKHLFS